MGWGARISFVEWLLGWSADRGYLIQGEHMERYKNIGGDSNVLAYELGPNSITVQFNDGSIYAYTSQSVGAANLAELQRLAQAGQALNSYINRYVRKGYARKLRW